MKEKSEKKQIATIWALTILIVILIAIVAGLIFIVLKTRKDENMKLKQQLVEQQEQLEEDARQKVIEQTKKETKALKLDTSKDWVYDAEYEKNADAELYTTNSNNIYYAKDVIVPYINIDSSDADKANNEIESILETVMKTYNTGVENKIEYVEECGYKKFVNGNTLSIIITYGLGATDVVHPQYKTYNFDLLTGNLMKYSEVYKLAGHNANTIEENVENAITKVMKEKMEPIESLGYSDGTNFDTYNNKSIENYKKSVTDNTIQYYLNDEKELNTIVELYIPAGTGKFDTIIPVTTTDKTKPTENEKQDGENTSIDGIKYDAIISFKRFGGEWSADYDYYICYGDCKIFEHEIESSSPLIDSEDPDVNEQPYEISHIKEYDIESDLMEKIKQFITETVNKNMIKRNEYTDGELKIGEKIYYIDDMNTFYQLLKEIENN